jgi:hypothetical protein
MARLDFEMEPHYRDTLAGILSFSSFAAAEETLKRLENLCRKYQSASDKKGVEYCRQIALLGRRRAELISRNKRVCLQKRLQKREIATWFKIWLETPDIFNNWLSMRKQTDEFKELLQFECLDKSKSGDRYVPGAKTF